MKVKQEKQEKGSRERPGDGCPGDERKSTDVT